MTELPIEIKGATEFTSHPTENVGNDISGDLMRRLQILASENPGDSSRLERLPLVPEFSHLSEHQIDVADMLRTAEQQAQTVRGVTAACALATPNVHFLDDRLGALAASMKDDVLDRDGNPKTPLEALQAAMLKERKHLAEQYATLISDNGLLLPDLSVKVDGEPDHWYRIGRKDLALVLQELLNTDKSSPEYPQIARMYFALQQGAEDTTLAHIYSALTSRGKTIADLNIQSGIARLPEGWNLQIFEEVADDELKWNPNTMSFGSEPLSQLDRVVMIPQALGGEHGRTGIPKLPSVSGKMQISH